eukprot:244920-Pyramimonas_sp.AAC.1
MHVVDLGVVSHIVANVCYEIVYEQSGKPAKLATQDLWTEIQQQYHDLNIPHRTTKFGRKMFIPKPDSPHSEFPCLSKSLKASQQRWLIP